MNFKVVPSLSSQPNASLFSSGCHWNVSLTKRMAFFSKTNFFKGVTSGSSFSISWNFSSTLLGKSGCPKCASGMTLFSALLVGLRLQKYTARCAESCGTHSNTVVTNCLLRLPMILLRAVPSS